MRANKLFLFGTFLKPYLVREFAVLLLMFLGTLLSLTSPYFLKIIIDQVIPGKDVNRLFHVLGLLFLLYIVRIGIDFYTDYLTAWISNRVVNDIKQRLFACLFKLPHSYFEENKSGEIIQKCNDEIHKIQGFLTNSGIRLLNNFFLLTGLVVMLCVLNVKLFLLSLVVVPASIFLNRFLNRKIKRQVELASQSEANIYSFYIDRLKNIKLIKDHNAGGRELVNLSNRWAFLFKVYLRTASYSSFARNVSTFFVALGPLLILAVGGYQAMRGALSIGSIVAFIQYTNRFYSPINDLIFLYTDYVKTNVSMERVIPILFPDSATDKNADRSKMPLSEINTLEVRDVCIQLGRSQVLENLSLHLVRGHRYALVGRSGSGKTTLLKLLTGVYTPGRGTVVINGSHGLASLTDEDIRARITVINQEVLYFHESLRYNITYGRPDITDAEVWDSLEELGMAEYVRQLPQQLDTVMGEGREAFLFSGGQLQIIGLIRAYIKDADVVILDESTCALDSVQERKIVQALFRKFRAKILILITHRLGSLRDFDEIMVLEGGRITEKGNLPALISNRGPFYHLFKSQIDFTHPQRSKSGV